MQSFIDAEYTSTVASAPFPTSRKIGTRAACEECPKRSVAQPNLLSTGDKAKDVCLDLACWREKTTRYGEDCAEEVTAAGGCVLPPEEARRILGTGGWLYSAKWVSLDAQCPMPWVMGTPARRYTGQRLVSCGAATAWRTT